MKLATTPANASAGVAIPITGIGAAATGHRLLVDSAGSGGATIANSARGTTAGTQSSADANTIARSSGGIGSGTVAAIDGAAKVTAASVAVNAREQLSVDEARSGGLGVGGAAGVGVGIVVVDSDADVSAFVAPSVRIDGLGGAGSLSIGAQLDSTITVLGVAGAASGIVALGAAVAVVDERGDVRSLLGGRVNTNGDVETGGTAIGFGPGIVDDTLHAITFDTDPDLHTGDAVVYRAGGAPIGGLEDGATYYAIVTPSTMSRPALVRLASTPSGAAIPITKAGAAATGHRLLVPSVAVAGAGFATVSVRADATRTLRLATGSGGISTGIAAGAAIAVVTVTGHTEALVGDVAAIGTDASPVGAVSVQALDYVSVGPHDDGAPMGIAISGAALAGQAGVTIVTIGDDAGEVYVRAEIGSLAVVHARGTVKVEAVSTRTATVEVDAGGGGLVAAGLVVDEADVVGITRAQIGSGAYVAGGAVDVRADATAHATATLVLVSVALFAKVGGGSATAKVDADAVALAGPAGTATATKTFVSATNGPVTVQATSTQSATATADGGGGGDVSVTFLNAEGDLTSSTTASLGDGMTVPAAGGLTVLAETITAAASAGGRRRLGRHDQHRRHLGERHERAAGDCLPGRRRRRRDDEQSNRGRRLRDCDRPRRGGRQRLGLRRRRDLGRRAAGSRHRRPGGGRPHRHRRVGRDGRRDRTQHHRPGDAGEHRPGVRGRRLHRVRPRRNRRRRRRLHRVRAGGTGGVGNFTFTSATLVGTPSVLATLAAKTLSAGQDVELDATSALGVTSYGDLGRRRRDQRRQVVGVDQSLHGRPDEAHGVGRGLHDADDRDRRRRYVDRRRARRHDRRLERPLDLVHCDLRGGGGVSDNIAFSYATFRTTSR